LKQKKKAIFRTEGQKMSNEYQVLFFTHTGAIKFDRAMKKENIPCELMPVPRVLSSTAA
jgi:hypothetical protein